MALERKGIFQFRNTDVTVVGDDIVVGQTAPEFTAYNSEWQKVDVLESTHGKVRIIGSLPSINSSVCSIETRRFNQEASNLSEDIVILTVSNDLPWTLKSWCAAEGIERVITLSDASLGEFGPAYGVLLKELRIFRRAVFVVDQNDKVTYVAYMPQLGNEPDYAEVLAAARSSLVQA